MIMFGLSSPPQYSPSDGSPQWRPGIHTSVTPLRLATPLDHTPSNCPKSLEPEYVRGTSRLTPRGKMQLIQGLRKSSNLHVPYLGDPLLQPIRSYENAALVRCLHSLSTHLNDKFAQQLQLIGASNSLWSRLAKLFLSPVPSPYTHPTFTTDDPPRTPTSGVSHVLTMPSRTSPTPRLSLRRFASYYTLTSLGLALVLLWLIVVPLWLLLLLSLSCGLVCGVCGCVRRRRSRTGHRKTQ
jgi:sphingomyelin phosphodiesterase 4